MPFLLRPAPCAELQAFERVRYLPTEWADGDSFRVLLPDGSEHTLRLYGADCLESRVRDGTDARRLRAQRRYFGLSHYRDSPQASIALAKSIGEAATVEVRRLLARPFTVHTAFADGRGDDRYKRIYAFVTTADGIDLATHLVSIGLARAFGVYRGSPRGLSLRDYRETLRDAELFAANKRLGAWAYTDWDRILAERQTERSESAELRLSTRKHRTTAAIDLNGASRDALMRIPGVGEVTANAIIGGRPYRKVDELLRIRGIGPKKLEHLRPWVTVSP